MEKLACRGFAVHSYTEKRRNRIYLLGRLEDGRSFAAASTRWRPYLHIYPKNLEAVSKLLHSIKHENNQTQIESFEGREKLHRLDFTDFSGRADAAAILTASGIPCPDADQKPADAFLIEHGIKGVIQIEGDCRPGRLVDLVFQDPAISPCGDLSPLDVPLRLCSVDIETDIKTGTITAVGMSVSPWNKLTEKRGVVRVLAANTNTINSQNIIFHHDEKSLLESFLHDIKEADPDVITGWNFLDFDYPRLAERCNVHRIPFRLGRADDEAKFFPAASSSDSQDGSWYDRRHSVAALVPGRQVVDALRIVRSGPARFQNYTLEAVAQAVLGISKIITSSGEQKIVELESLYQNDPVMFGEYCLRDAELVPEILEKTGLFRLSLERASLTGVSLDKAWTSVVSFERIYGTELRRRNIAPPAKASEARVSGAAGGTVLEPLTGLFSNVGVFDFRSLYPTIIRTFNIDPRAYALSFCSDINAGEKITAPNGAIFIKEGGILPELIASYFVARRRAIDEGDVEASHVYKILMNSFYGVLGASSCRYGKTELAGAITSFARKWLLFSRDWFESRGYKVLYGDTDSLFVESGLDDSSDYENFAFNWGKKLADEINRNITDAVETEYGLKSYMELRFEKPYRRFMIPPLRNLQNGESRGRAKGYGGWILDSNGDFKIEVKGMEAVRSDATPLARRLQLELLELVFRGVGEKEFRSHVVNTLNDLRRGKLDDELIYRKRLSRPPEEYTASTPPQVKAARALGWKNRRGTVEYVWTVSGPEPASLVQSLLDYDHYADTQVLSVVRSIAAAAGWDVNFFPNSKKNCLVDAQIELEF